MHKKIVVSAIAAIAALSAGLAHAESPWMVRARAVNLDWDNKNADNLQNAGVGDVSAKKRWIPEVDISYFFTPNIAAELVLTYPQDVDIQTSALGKIGKVQALPPSLLVQYHFTELGAFKPYVGLGVNYTIFTKKSFNTALGKISVDDNTVGLAAQVGFDYAIDKNWSCNVDAKYIQMETDVKLEGTKLGKLGLNPMTYGVGVGYRF